MSKEESKKETSMKEGTASTVLSPSPAELAKAADPKVSLSLVVPIEERTTTPYMTKFEKAQILGTRAHQISIGSPILVELTGEKDPLAIATKELHVRARIHPSISDPFLYIGSCDSHGHSEIPSRWALRRLVPPRTRHSIFFLIILLLKENPCFCVSMPTDDPDHH